MTEYEIEALSNQADMIAKQADTLSKLDTTILHLHNISVYVVSFFKVLGIAIAFYVAVWFVRTYILGTVRSYFRFRI